MQPGACTGEVVSEGAVRAITKSKPHACSTVEEQFLIAGVELASPNNCEVLQVLVQAQFTIHLPVARSRRSQRSNSYYPVLMKHTDSSNTIKLAIEYHLH